MAEQADKPVAARPVAARGIRCVVEFAVCSDGKSPAKEFIDGLDFKVQVKLVALFQRLADHGEIKDGQKFKKLRGSILEFKSYQIRIPCFWDEKAVVLTHGFIKKSDKVRTEETDRADNIRAQDLARKNRPTKGKTR